MSQVFFTDSNCLRTFDPNSTAVSTVCGRPSNRTSPSTPLTPVNGHCSTAVFDGAY